jgi:hypothetical protein
MGEKKRKAYQSLVRKPQRHLCDLNVVGNIILKWFLENKNVDVGLTGLDQGKMKMIRECEFLSSLKVENLHCIRKYYFFKEDFVHYVC